MGAEAHRDFNLVSSNPSAPVVFSAIAWLRPYDYSHDRYSAYYRDGLRRHLAEVGGNYEEVSLGRCPRVLQALRRVRDAYRLKPLWVRAGWLLKGIDRAAQFIEGPIQLPAGVSVEAVSHYLLKMDPGQSIRVSVDARDAANLIDREVIGWSDIYLKTNYWPSINYPSKVRPFFNLDPLVIPQCSILRGHRATSKKYDVSMIVRIWGGRDDAEGVEHNLRLIEAVSKARCKKFLYAYLVAGDIAAAAQRLARQGIPYGEKPLAPERLWRVSAASHLNIIRLGMHYCTPWRVTGALAIGSAIVLDRDPLSLWPEPLTAGVHFLSLAAETNVGQPLASEAQYGAIPAMIESWLADRNLAERIGRNNAEYFDRFLVPQRVGERIVREAQSHVTTTGLSSEEVTTAGVVGKVV